MIIRYLGPEDLLLGPPLFCSGLDPLMHGSEARNLGFGRNLNALSVLEVM